MCYINIIEYKRLMCKYVHTPHVCCEPAIEKTSFCAASEAVGQTWTYLQVFTQLYEMLLKLY